jgi:8-oxo-dGTP pyrophosphatase MutT (NUDIX family)
MQHFVSDKISAMGILTEIQCKPGINLNGKTIHRTAVRGVILRGKNLLMIYSSNVGDYKFPGGGVGEGETHTQALIREIQEECGMSVLHIGSEIGTVIEYDIPLENDYDVFKMTSHYYQCEIQDGFGAQKLDGYEQDLGFKPVWIDVEDAIRLNKDLLPTDKSPRWLKREIFILEYLQQNLLLK